MNKKLKFNLIIAIIVTAIILYFFIGHNRRLNLLSSDDIHYSVGTIVSVERGAKVAPWFNFEFYDGKKIVKGQYSLAKKPELSTQKKSILTEYIGRKFLIKFASENSKFNELYFDLEITDSLNISNKKIWDKNPFLH